MKTSQALPSGVDYRRLAVQRGRVEGEISIARIGRMAGEIADDQRREESVHVDLAFSEDAQRRVRVQGTIETILRLVCQRCLQPFDLPMRVAVAGVVVADDQSAAGVPREDEPLMAEGDTLDVMALVADELLLALPPVARCDRPACSGQYDVSDRDTTATRDKRRTDNPFAVLDQLRRTD